jgi:ferredoxin
MISRIVSPSKSKSLLFVVRCNTFSIEVKDWLKAKGYNQSVTDGIIKAFPGGKVSLNEVKSLGDSGLKALVLAVERQSVDSKVKKDMITIHVSVPHERYSFDMKVPVGGNFQTAVNDNEDLAQFLECACGGNAACSTCHVVVDPEYFLRLPPPDETELDMLDLAAGLTDTSRLGCQIVFQKNLDGMKVTVPSESNNLFGSSGSTSA